MVPRRRKPEERLEGVMEQATEQHWERVRERAYRLRLPELTASLLLHAGPAGLRRLSSHGLVIPGPVLAVSQWLAQGVDPRPAPARGGTWQHWSREQQVVACFDEGPANPTRYELRWRVLESSLLELEVSVSTSIVPPLRGFELFTVGQVSSGELLAAVADGERSVRWLELSEQTRTWQTLVRDEQVSGLLRDGRWPAAARAAVLGQYGLAVVVYRPNGLSWSYLELGHPMDVTRIIVRRRGCRLRWAFGLFGLDLEKGVILRTRLRATVVPRCDDLACAERLAQQLLASPPSLSA